MIMLKLNIFLSFTAKTYLKPKYFSIFMNERDSCTAFWLGLTLRNTPFPLKNISSQHHHLTVKHLPTPFGPQATPSDLCWVKETGAVATALLLNF